VDRTISSRFLVSCKKIIDELNIIWLLNWIPNAIIKGYNLCRKNDYDIIISSGQSEPHLVAFVLKIFNRKLNWIADYGDPWSVDPTHDKEHGRIKCMMDHIVENVILRYIDHLIFTTEETKKLYQQKFIYGREKAITVVPMGSNFSLFNHIDPIRSKKFRFLYVGSIYPHRDVKSFIQALKTLTQNGLVNEKIEFVFVGHLEERIKQLFNDVENLVTFYDFVPYEKSISYMKGADVLLSFGNCGGLQVPGKLFDYLCSDKPILWIIGDSADPALHYLINHPHAHIVTNDTNEIHDIIIELYKKYSLSTTLETDNSSCTQHSWESRIAIIDRICKDMVACQK
jgi:glycosyltransferase involved in cell wall biosynthesis